MTEPPGEGPPGWSLSSVGAGVLVALLGLTVALMVISFPAGLYATFSGRLSPTYGPGTLITPYFWVGPMVGLVPFSVGAGWLFVFLLGVYAALFALLAAKSPGPLDAIRRALRDGPEALASSPLVATIIAVGFLVFTATIVDSLVNSAGVPIGGISGDPFEIFVGFTLAPLVEEIGFRVLIIGVVAFVLSLGMANRSALGALWRPSRVLEGVALGSGTSIILWASVAFSSATFGVCHVACGGAGWEIGKLPEAAYGGLVLGYVYVKYGFPAAVIAHWGIDYFGSALSFFGQAAYGIPWNSASEFFGQSLVDADLLYLFGLASFLLVAYLGVRKLVASRGAGIDKPPPEGVTPAI